MLSLSTKTYFHPTSAFMFQIRLDFNTFAISGPSTLTVSATGLLFTNGATDSANGKEGSQRTRCSTDTFSISHGNVPTLCGTLTGEHSK